MTPETIIAIGLALSGLIGSVSAAIVALRKRDTPELARLNKQVKWYRRWTDRLVAAISTQGGTLPPEPPGKLSEDDS